MRTRQASRLVLALRERGLERELRLAACAILFGVEAGEMLADDLVGRIALDTLRARIPVGHMPLGVEHVERMVADALDERPEALLAFEKGPLVLALAVMSRVILAKPMCWPVGIEDRIEDGIGPEPGPVLADAPALGFEAPLRQRLCAMPLPGARPHDPPA